MATNERQELAGRVAIVTGAGRNIGRAIALALAAGGAKVVVNARTSEAEAARVAAEIETGGGQATAILADVADRAAVARMVDQAVERFGRVDFLVNNAAVRREAAFDRLAVDEWRSILATILDGAFHCVQTCLPHLRKSDRAAVVNIGGLTGHTGAKERAHVVTAKAGLVGFTRALAHDLAADGITVNCVSPGLIDTVRSRASAEQPHHHQTHTTLLGRRGTPDEVAATVRFLCGPEARYITGQTLHVNGGVFLG